MENTVWLIISDLHLYYKNLASHLDYVQEMIDVRGEIMKIANRYKEDGFEFVNLLLLGDVFHRSYSKADVAIGDNNFFVMWNQHYGECYSVVGNHELSYYKSNPFFSMVKTIDSEKLKGITNKVWTPTGLLPIIKVVDELEIADVRFLFNHYGTQISRATADGKKNIGLFHHDLVNSEIKQMMVNQRGHDFWSETVEFDNSGVLDGYDYCFFGHMHQVYGTFQMDSGTILCYLASLGRTNIQEISNDFLERNIPAVKIRGKFMGIDDNKITLPSLEESVNISKVLQKQEDSEKRARRKFAKEYAPLDDDPVKSLQTFYAQDAYRLTIINELLHNSIDSIGIDLRSKVNKKLSR